MNHHPDLFSFLFAVDNPKQVSDQAFFDRMHRLLNGDQKFLTVDEVLKDEYLHFHGLLSVFRSIGHGTVPYAYIPPVETVPEIGQGSGITTAALQASPSPSSTQDDELANLAEKHREGYIAPEETTSPDKSKSFQESPLRASEGDVPSTDEHIFQGLGDLPLPETIYTSEDFRKDPLVFTSSEETTPAKAKEPARTSLASDSGWLGGHTHHIGCTLHRSTSIHCTSFSMDPLILNFV